MSLFYLCPQERCNRKYKTELKLKEHLVTQHKVLIDESNPIGEPIEINKDNKKNIEEKRNQDRLQERINARNEELRHENEEREKLKEEILAKEREQFALEHAARYRMIEEQKLKQKERELQDREERERKLRSSPRGQGKEIELLEPASEKDKKDEKQDRENAQCVMCLEKDAVMAVIPCGHKNFCEECINDYRSSSYLNKGCPVCRGDIIMIARIFD